MENKDFFVNETIIDLSVSGKIFKYKPVTAGDELDWINDYIEEIEIEKDGKKFIRKRTNLAKLSLCKLRNIVEVPFDLPTLNEITKINKPFSEYSNEEKDLLFRKIRQDIYNQLIIAIDNINDYKKKD